MKTPPFEELKSLDLQKCDSVGEIVSAMRYCAFGARMLGEVAHPGEARGAGRAAMKLIDSLGHAA